MEILWEYSGNLTGAKRQEWGKYNVGPLNLMFVGL